MSFKCWQEDINDYLKLIENEEDCDVIIYASENKNEKIHAHSLILSARSQYFCITVYYLKTMLKKGWKNHF